jgi:glycosyl transferase family 1
VIHPLARSPRPRLRPFGRFPASPPAASKSKPIEAVETTPQPSWLFVSVDDPNELRSASGIFARSLLAALRTFGEVQLVVVPGVASHRRWRRRLAQAVSLARTQPALVGTVDTAKIRREVLRAAALSPGRPIFLNHLRSACFLAQFPEIPGHPVVYVAQNCEAQSARSLCDLPSSSVQRWILKREAAKIAELEARVCAVATHVVTLTDEDAARFSSLCPVTCLPPPLEPESIPVPAPQPGGDGATVALISSFHWTPKKWNAHWIVEEVMPRVWARLPEANLLVAGAGAARLGIRHRSISIESDVSDIRPCYHRADIVLVPDRQRSGLKFKTVQAALAGKAIVSTPAGIEGTALVDGESVLVRISAHGFAEAIVELLANPEYRASLGCRAEAAARERFSHDRILNQLRSFLENLEATPLTPPGTPVHSGRAVSEEAP